MCGNITTTTQREYPHNIPSNHRRFKNGEWQRPTEKGRGWRPSIGLKGMTYEQGVNQLISLNGDRYRTVKLVDVTTGDQMPAAHAAAANLPTNPMHRRFNTVTQQWEKPNSTMTGWKPSGIAFYSLEAGNAFFAQNRGGYINVGAVNPEQPNETVLRCIENEPIFVQSFDCPTGPIVPQGGSPLFILIQCGDEDNIKYYVPRKQTAPTIRGDTR